MTASPIHPARQIGFSDLLAELDASVMLTPTMRGTTEWCRERLIR